MKQHIPPIHPEWVQRDHTLIAFAYTRDIWDSLGYSSCCPDLDLFGVPILTPEARKSLGDEWYNWSKAQ